MKKILLFLVALVATLGMNAQTTEIYKGAEKVATYSGADVKVTFGTNSITVVKDAGQPVTYTGSDYKVVSKELPPPAPVLPDGALAGEFSVADGKKVHFSQGNLVATIDATGAPTAWKFAANQYDYIGKATANNSIGSTAGDVDLFGWSTDAASNNWGIHTKTSETDGFTTGDFKDWGTAIDSKGTWRTLSMDEWVYLFNTRTASTVSGTENARYAMATVNSEAGIIILPDTYTHPEGVTALTNINTAKAEFTSNTYDSADWAKMESAGAVFLPVAGLRSGYNVYNAGGFGYYWSSSVYNTSQAYLVKFWNGEFQNNGAVREFHYKGHSVRLITESGAPAPQVISVESVSLNKSTLELAVGSDETLTATVTPDNATDKSVSWSSSDESVATVDASGKVTAVAAGTATITVTTTDGGKTTTCTVTVKAPEPEYVEIGGVKWATKNLGAEKVTDYGDYFAWGETAPYYEGTGGWPTTPTWKSGKASGYTWQSYCGSSSFSEWSTPPYDATTKILKPEFDAAAQILGDGWRMPTSAEFKALYDACGGSYDTSTNPSGASASVGKGVYWCTSYDGVAGCLFCDGTNKLFFPAAGIGFNTDLSEAGSYGLYWSSSLNTRYNTGNADYLKIYSSQVSSQNSFDRFRGLSVRPVKDAAAPLPAGALAGEFTVAEGKKVHFSQGNLVATINATGAPTAWKFAANQYDYLGEGEANNSIGSTAGDIDYFGWSTAKTTYGISTSQTSGDYSGDFVDWGKNIGDGNTWRTLSKDEWTYLFNTRTVNGGKGAEKSYSLNITYGGKMGVVLYPDDYTGSVLSGTVDSLPEGVVFLPAAGYRNGSNVDDVGVYGHYWSSAAFNSDSAYKVLFYSSAVLLNSGCFRYFGCSVRLITDVK